MLDEAVVTERIAQLAAGLNERAADLTVDLINLYARELPHLVNDDESVVSLLSASLYQNIDTGLRIFQHGIDPTRVEAPAAAMEYARRLAQRGTPVIDLIRAYYLGQTAILGEAFDEGVRQVEDPVLMGAMMRRALDVTFTFIDRVTQQVITAYQEERDRWLLNWSAARTARVRALLDGDDSDLDASEEALGYRLRGLHLGMILWRPEGTHDGDGPGQLEPLALELRKKVPGGGAPLFVPHDELCAWVWLPLEKDELPDRADIERVLEDAPDVRLAVGDPGRGVAGFRNTHRQAMRVHALGVAAGEHSDRALMFREVGSIALLSSDLNAARAWVTDVLGPIATHDSQHERLRETLRVFLATGSSYTAAAARLTMHKNSVQYRVRKAEELLPRPVTENRLDVELALNICHRLGAAVLTPA